MSKRSWVDSLQEMVTRLERGPESRLKAGKKRPLRFAVVGIGHELRGDDAAGLVVAQRLRPFAHQHLLIVEAGHAPENHTGLLRRFNPDMVILIDCALLNEPPGTIGWLPWQETTGLSASSHTMPPYMLARYLTAELNTEVVLIGIQPANTELGAPLSLQIEEAVQEIVGVVGGSLGSVNSRQ